MTIKLPDFKMIGQASTPAEMAAKLKCAATNADTSTELEAFCELLNARRAVDRDSITHAWYEAAVAETQHELTNCNGAALLP